MDNLMVCLSDSSVSLAVATKKKNKKTHTLKKITEKRKSKSIYNHRKKYMRQTLVFMWNSAIRETFNFYFSAVFAIIQTNLSLEWRLGTRL